MFTSSEYIAVESINNIYTSQNTTIVGNYSIFEYKDFIGSINSVFIIWVGRTSLAPVLSTVYLQVFNNTTQSWETLVSNNITAADINFTLSATISNNLNDYFDEFQRVICRVYQRSI